jgi:hypothetical protein
MTRSLRLLPLPVEAALPPNAMEIAVRIADLPPVDQLSPKDKHTPVMSNKEIHLSSEIGSQMSMTHEISQCH